MLEEWRRSVVVPIFKNKGDAHDRCGQTGISIDYEVC